MGPFRLIAWFWAILATGGCAKNLSAEINQPNPYLYPREVLFVSAPLAIVTHDMDLKVPSRTGIGGYDKVPLIQAARFVIVSRDRLRFHIQVEHKWEDYANLGSWEAELIVDGKKYAYDSREPRAPEHKTTMWDYERRSVVRNNFGDIVHVNQDGWRQRQTLASIDYFRGKGDFTFYARDLFTKETKKVKLVLRRGRITHTYVWNFRD